MPKKHTVGDDTNRTQSTTADKAGTRRHTHRFNRLIHEQWSLDSNDETLSLGEHIPIGTLNIVAF